MQYYMFGVYLFSFITMYTFLFKLTIITDKRFCHIDVFTMLLWDLNKVDYV